MREISMALSMFQNVYACRFESGKNVVSIMFLASNAHLNPRDFAIIEPVKKNTEYDLIMEKLNIIPHPQGQAASLPVSRPDEGLVYSGSSKATAQTLSLQYGQALVSLPRLWDAN